MEIAVARPHEGSLLWRLAQRGAWSSRSLCALPAHSHPHGQNHHTSLFGHAMVNCRKKLASAIKANYEKSCT